MFWIETTVVLYPLLLHIYITLFSRYAGTKQVVSTVLEICKKSSFRPPRKWIKDDMCLLKYQWIWRFKPHEDVSDITLYCITEVGKLWWYFKGTALFQRRWTDWARPELSFRSSMIVTIWTKRNQKTGLCTKPYLHKCNSLKMLWPHIRLLCDRWQRDCIKTLKIKS